MPTLKAGDVAPHDLDALGSYLRNLNGADINLTEQVDIIDALLTNAELPLLDRDLYQKGLDDKKKAAEAELQAKIAPPVVAKPTERPPTK